MVYCVVVGCTLTIQTKKVRKSERSTYVNTISKRLCIENGTAFCCVWGLMTPQNSDETLNSSDYSIDYILDYNISPHYVYFCDTKKKYKI